MSRRFDQIVVIIRIEIKLNKQLSNIIESIEDGVIEIW